MEPIQDPATSREVRRLTEEMRSNLRLIVLNAAPKRVVDGMMVICDGTNWNPVGGGIKQPVWYDADLPGWKAV